MQSVGTLQRAIRPLAQQPCPSVPDDAQELAKLQVPVEVRSRVSEILAIADQACLACLDEEYAQLCARLVARLSRKRPSPLVRADTRIWAAGAIYALGRVNFLFDPSQRPHVSADQLATHLGVVKSSMASKAALIRKALGLGVYEPDLTRRSMLEQHPLAWPRPGQRIPRRRSHPSGGDPRRGAQACGLIPDLDQRRAA